MSSSRRDFLKASLAAVPFVWPGMRLAFAEGAVQPQTLVVLFLRGAMDGLNTVIPYGESRYQELRPSIGIGAPQSDTNTARNLDGFFALHPALAPLLPLWEKKQLAIVHACGSPDPTRSHFDAQDFMESGTPGVKSTSDGWLNRYLQRDATAHAELRAVSITQTLPRMLQGTAPAVAVNKLSDFAVRSPIGQDSFESLYAGSVDKVLRGTFDAVHSLARVSQLPVLNGAAYPKGRLGDALRQIAQLAHANVGLEIAFADAGGFDTHVRQGAANGQLAQRLAELGQGLAAFATDLGSQLDRVSVVVMSEFGRTARENGTGGTDHGHGSALFVMGGAVNGGRVHGHWPGMSDTQLYEARDLAVTTDFRSVLCDVLSAHLRVKNPAALFADFTPARTTLFS